MRAWVLAGAFALLGVALGYMVASGAGVNSQQPLWSFAGAVGLAILGAILGGTSDIIQAVREAARSNRQS